MDVLNMNQFAVHPRVIAPDGTVDSVTVMSKRRVTLPEGYKVDGNWLGSIANVSIFESKSARKPMQVGTSVGSVVTSVANAVKSSGGTATAVPVGAANATDEAIRAAQYQAQLNAQALLAAQRDSGNIQPAPVEVQPEEPEADAAVEDDAN